MKVRKVNEVQVQERLWLSRLSSMRMTKYSELKRLAGNREVKEVIMECSYKTDLRVDCHRRKKKFNVTKCIKPDKKLAIHITLF